MTKTKFKQTEIGMIPEDWDIKKIDELTEIEMGQSPPGETCNSDNNGMPLINGPTEFGTHHPIPVQYTTDPKKFALPNDILFCVRGSTTGRMNWADRRYAIGRGIAAIRHKKGMEYQHFLKALIEYQTPKLLKAATGSTFPNVSREQLRNLLCFIPPLPEQHAIAHIFSTIDDKTALDRQMNSTLEAIAQALFRRWFVDFEFPNEKGKPYRSSGGEMVDSELGRIPEGWRVGMFGDVAKNLRRGIQANDIEANTPYIGLEHMPRNCISLFEWGQAETLESNKFEFKKGEILFGKLRPYFHKVGVAPIDGVCSTDILVVCPEQTQWFGLVLGHISSVEFINHTDASSTGTKMPRAYWHDMVQYKIVIPSEHIAVSFTEQIIPLIVKLMANIHESQTLSTIRDSLLPKLMSGQIRVPSGAK